MADELIYKVKLELDQKSREDLENQLKKVESSARRSSGGKAGGDSEKEVSVLKELKQQLASYREELAKVNQQASQSATTNDSLRSSQTQLGSAIRETSAQIQEANKGYADQQTALSSVPNTLNQLIEKQSALSKAIADTPINEQTGRLEELRREYKDNQSAIDTFKASLKDTDVALRQTGTTLADLKTEQKALQSAIENTPINEQKGRLEELKAKLAENNAQIKQFTDSIKESTTAQDSSSKKSEQQSTTLQALKERLSLYRTELAEVNEQARQNGGADENLRAKQQELGEAIRSTSTQIQEAQRGYGDLDSVIKSIPQTYNDLVEQNRALSLAMKKVPLNDTTERLDSLKKQYLENNVRLKEFDASIGNNQRNVGNYSSALDGTVDTLREMSTAFAVVQGPLGPLAGRINSLATFFKKMSERTKETTQTQTMFGKVLSGNIPFIQTSASALTAKGVAAKGANAGIGLLNIGLKGLRLTLISLGIPAIALAVLSLSQAFTRTEEGAQKLRVITAGFTATMDVLRDLVADIGDRLIEAFENPQQAVKDLWEAIKQNLINRFAAVPKMFVEGFDVIAKGAQYASKVIQGLFDPKAAAEAVILYGELGREFVDFGNAVGQLLTGIEDPLTKIADGLSEIKKEIDADAAAAKALQDRMNDVLVTERELGVERAKQNRDLQEARVIARNMEMDAQSRLEAINKVAKAEKEMADKELANERERLAIMQAQAELSKTDEKTKQAIAQQQEKVFGLEAASLEKLMRLGRDRLAVERQIREENVRRARFAFEMESAQQDMLNDKLRNRLKEEGRLREALENDLNRIVDERAQEESRIREVYLTEFLNQKFTQEEASRMAEEKARIEMDGRIFEASEALRAQRIAEQRSSDAFERGLAEQRKNFEIQVQKDILLARNDQLSAFRINEVATEQGQRDRLKEIYLKSLQDLKDQGLDPFEAENRAKAMAQMQLDKEVHDYKMGLAQLERDQRLQMAEQIASGLSAINSAFFKDSKELAVASAIMDTYAGAQSAFAQTEGGILIKSLAAITATAMGIANVKKILATKLGDKSVSATATSQPNIGTSFGLVDVGTNAPIAEQVAGMSGLPRQNMNPTFVFTGDLDPEVMAIKVNQGSNAISSRTLGVGI
jgi:hypothetical protein